MTQSDPETIPENDPLDPIANPPGISELSTISVLNGDWEGLSIDLTGPDGTEVLGRLVYFACPLCAAVVAPEYPDPDTGDIRSFRQAHAADHIRQARDWDQVNRLIAALIETQDNDDPAGD